jgi:hypothetical protein
VKKEAESKSEKMTEKRKAELAKTQLPKTNLKCHIVGSRKRERYKPEKQEGNAISWVAAKERTHKTQETKLTENMKDGSHRQVISSCEREKARTVSQRGGFTLDFSWRFFYNKGENTEAKLTQILCALVGKEPRQEGSCVEKWM